MPRKTKKRTTEWLGPSETAAFLGCCLQTLARRRRDQTFVLGKHYRIVGSRFARRPTYRYHARRCAEALGMEVDG